MLTVAKGRLVIMYKLIAIAAFLSAALYISYSVASAAVVSAEIASCCYASAENQETPYTGLCCTKAETGSDCCNNENPPQEETFTLSGLFGKLTHHNDMCDLQKRLSGISFAELSGIGGEERFHSINITYFIFKPPKV